MSMYQQVKGLAVVTMAEGKKLGQIEKLIVDPNGKQLRWLRLRDNRMGNDRRLVAADAVHAFGSQAVIVNTETDAKTAAEAQEAEDLEGSNRSIIGHKLVTDTGNFIGKVGDYEFDAHTLRVTNINVSTGAFGKSLSIPADEVLTIGKDVTGRI